MRIGRRSIDISNRDKVFFPDDGITKGDLIDYYEAVAEQFVSHSADYGVTIQRFPDGIGEDGFYSKNTPDYFPEWIKRVSFPRRKGGSFDAPVIGSKAALVYLADQAMITAHLYLSRKDDLEKPDRMIFDLDPPEGTKDYSKARKAAIDLRDILAELDLKAFVKTTGSNGYHLIVPIRRGPSFDDVRGFARKVSESLIEGDPGSYTLEQRKDKRGKKIFLDTLRNSYGNTAVAPYSVRARKGAPVATPVEWDEIEDGVDPREWTIENVPRRLAQRGDPWKGMMRHARSLESRKVM
ncbi:MAG: non-homologous end-joining DNA ligase [Acidobacteriota bacterium]|nr:MAG: non-homologous end-joining DNA ligase [Acidobacteriota bacterium]